MIVDYTNTILHALSDKFSKKNINTCKLAYRKSINIRMEGISDSEVESTIEKCLPSIENMLPKDKVFCPADKLSKCNTEAEPIYCFHFPEIGVLEICAYWKD